MIGNHRDAWTFGSIDPNSGTVVLLETARVLSEMKKNNQWKPKRSVIFMSWGSAEQGLIGSTEWVEVSKHGLFFS
jgi:Zn-dependent M28 family amino/carboxypeptidase